MEEKNLPELSVVKSDYHLSLNILDIISFLGKNKLEYLGDEVATEIVTEFNALVEEEFYLTPGMSGLDIREQFHKLPNKTKNTMKNQVIIHGLVSKSFFNNLIRFSSEENEFLLRDDEVKGSLVNMFSILVIITSLLILYIYHSTAGYREVLKNTMSSRAIETVMELINHYLQ